VAPIATVDATDGDSGDPGSISSRRADAHHQLSFGRDPPGPLTINGNTSGTLIYGTKTITYSWDATYGVLTLSGPATFDNYENALSQIRFSTSGDNITDYGNAPTRTLAWSVFDGLLYSDETTATVFVTGINDAPVMRLRPTPSPSRGLDRRERSAVVRSTPSPEFRFRTSMPIRGAGYHRHPLGDHRHPFVRTDRDRRHRRRRRHRQRHGTVIITATQNEITPRWPRFRTGFPSQANGPRLHACARLHGAAR
jgi:hypothetical protein